MNTPINEAVERERQAFEAWARKTGYDDRDLERSSATPGAYTWRETQHSWMTWQARAALPPPIVEPVKDTPSGYAYRYPDGYIRFTNGEEINGSRPAEAVPYYFGSAPTTTQASAPSDERGPMDAESLSAILWLYHRLPHGYKRQDHIERTIRLLAKRTGTDVESEIASRICASDRAPSDGAADARVAELESVIRDALTWVESKHRPPKPDHCGTMAYIRLDALANLHKALHGKYDIAAIASTHTTTGGENE